jgi:hypothetical protein
MRGLTYEPATPNDPHAQLTERSRQGDKRKPIPRSAWRFVEPELKGGPGRVQLEGGFKPDTIYEITYVAKDPYVTGAGLAGIRDLLSYFRDHPFEGAPAPRNVLMFGISQSGRLIGRMMPMASMSMKAASWYSTAPTCKCRAPAARQASTAASPSRPVIHR